MAILDAQGKPITVTKPPERSLATVAIRDKWGTYPANGLTPQRLAMILREADQGDLSQQAELFSQMEQRLPHLASVLQTRKLAISGLEWKFEPFSEDAKDVEIAARFTAMWEELDTDELLLDMMDAVSKGVSFVALSWAVKDGGFVVNSTEPIDQKNWRYDLDDKLFRLITEEQPQGLLPTFGQVLEHRYRARSGSPTQAGVMRTCVWMYQVWEGIMRLWKSTKMRLWRKQLLRVLKVKEKCFLRWLKTRQWTGSTAYRATIV